ncbi:hypothetical protein KKH18_14030, partial [bacterium]|nr:hypothetical protein [bacterium]
YLKSTQIEKKKLKKILATNIEVVPGLDAYTKEDWDNLRKDVESGKIDALLNVVSYGYHEFREPRNYKAHSIFAEGMTKKKFVSDYTDKRRNTEIAHLGYICKAIKKAKNNIWMMTVVTKQDLWWREKDRVVNHYEQGEYNKVLEGTLLEKERGFSHSFIYVSIIRENWKTHDGTVLMEVSPGYEDREHNLSRNHLLNELIRNARGGA